MKKKLDSLRKEGSTGEKSSFSSFRMNAKNYFLTYKGISDFGQKITKEGLASYFLQRSKNCKIPLSKYLICQQMYDSGQPHFHVMLQYEKRKQITSASTFDYLGIHPNIQTIRNMKATLQYCHKEDPHPLTNMDVAQQFRVARAKDSSSLYQLLEEQLRKDPFKFDLDKYCVTHNLFKQIYKANYLKATRLIKQAQPAFARHILSSKPGLCYITPDLIRQKLNAHELEQFYAYPCYQNIIDHINQITAFPNRDENTMAPLKTRHLLLVGDTNIGKTSLIAHRPSTLDSHPGLAYHLATYYLSIGQKYFPPYRSFDYRLVAWQQFTICSDLFPKSGYNRLLNYLDGSPSALPQKGRAPVQRQDNPKHILTSNRSLEQHICKTFTSHQSRQKARSALRARIDEVLIPPGRSVHFLRKLFVPASLSV